MKKVYMVERGTESSTGALDDPAQCEFGDLDEAIDFYNDIDLRNEYGEAEYRAEEED